MKYVAVVKDKYQDNAKWEIMKRDEKSKKEFKETLSGNGYILKHGYIFTEEEFNDDNFLEELDRKEKWKNFKKNNRSQSRKRLKKLLGE